MGNFKTVSLFLLLGLVAANTLVSCNNTSEESTDYDVVGSRDFYVEQKQMFREAVAQFEKEHDYKILPFNNCKTPAEDGLGCMLTSADFALNSWLESMFCMDVCKAPDPIDTSTILLGESYFFKGTKDLGGKMYYRFSVTRWQFDNVESSNSAFELGRYLFHSCDKINSHHFLVGNNWYVFSAGGNYAYEETGKAMQYFKARLDK